MSFYYKDIEVGCESESQVGVSNRLDDKREDFSTLSFESLKNAQDTLLEEERKDRKKKQKGDNKHILDSTRGSVGHYKSRDTVNEAYVSKKHQVISAEGDFFEEDSKNSKHKSRNKHGPKEYSSKKRVSNIRQIPGLLYAKRENHLDQDIRFDKSMSKVGNFDKVRDRYKFLDEYRENEIKELEAILADKKLTSKISECDRRDLEVKLTALKSRLKSVKNKEIERDVIKNYEAQLNINNKTKFHLKNSEKRKVIQKWKFDRMNSKQRTKVIERKRKKRLGKEFRSFESHRSSLNH